MPMKQTEYGTAIDILFNLDPYTARPIMVEDDNINANSDGRKIVKAGSLLDKDGKLANDETVRYVLLKDTDVTAGDAPGAGVYRGTLNLDKIESNTGVTIGEDAKTALKGIFFMSDENRDYNAGYGNNDSEALAFKIFTTEHAVVLALTEGTVAAANTAAVLAALVAYEALPAGVKVLAADDKILLDALLIAAYADEYATFTTTHASALALTVEDGDNQATSLNQTIVEAALTAYELLSDSAKVLAADDKTLLDALLAFIGTLE